MNSKQIIAFAIGVAVGVYVVPRLRGMVANTVGVGV
jgi:hypothetical protein